MQSNFCTISGSAPKKSLYSIDERDISFIRFKYRLNEELISLHKQQNVTDFICSCERGLPLWAAEAVLSLKLLYPVRLNISVPYEDQATKWTEPWRNRYFNIHEKADSIVFVNKQYSDICYNECDKYMIDNSDMLFWVGDEPSDIVDYAKEKHKPVISINTEDIQL